MRMMWASVSSDKTHGYGVVGARLYRAFKDLGVDLVRPDSFDWDVEVVTALPMAWLIGGDFKRHDLVYHTMFEFYPVPSGWIDVLNRAGLVWFPSHFVQNLFNDCGLKTPSFVSGYGVDLDIFYPVDRHSRTGPLKYLIWGHKLTGRKNVLKTITAFIRAGLEDVELEVKVRSNMSASYIQNELGEPYPNITIFAEDWSTRELADWLRRGDVLIYLSGGEGFGLQPLEAMATGLPVICTDATGMTEYLSEDVAYLVPVTGKRVGDASYDLRFGGTFTCEEPDYDVAIELMRFVRYNIDEARAKGLSAADYVSRVWTWDLQAKQALANISAFYL